MACVCVRAIEREVVRDEPFATSGGLVSIGYKLHSDKYVMWESGVVG